MYKQAIIAGKGKLATELLESMQIVELLKKTSWRNNKTENIRSIIIHAGSGRELPELVNFCKKTNSTLIELSTGSVLEGKQLVLESKVFGESSYASGVSKIINATYYNSLENRNYAINEYIENGWL